jgi:hypothetical protein
MAKTFYGYKERDVDTTLNWFEIGQQVSNVILENDKRRKEEKAAIDTATREFMETLNNAPQGINQDANNFTNNFTSDMMKQAMIDEKLLKSGQMDLNTYMLRRNNYIDGTKRLYNLQKLYQENAQKIMDEIDADEIQSELTFFNMKSVEGYADFNNSKATIDSLGDGKIGMALYENKIIDGKPMKVLSKNMAPVNVIEGKIMSRPKKFKTDAATTRIADSLGVKEGALYKAATTSGAGTITNFLGIEAMGTQYETFKGVIDATNEAIDGQIKASLSNPYNLTSVLAQDTGKYNSSSFTYDREEARKDPSKILLKIDPSTTQPIMDTDAPHYDAQFKEASEWMRKDILSKMDRKIDIKTTSQLSLNEPRAKTQSEIDEEKEAQEAKAFARQLFNVTAGNDVDAENSVKYFQSLFDLLDVDTKPQIERTDEGITITNSGGEKVTFKYDVNGKLQNPLELQRQIESALNVKGLNSDVIDKELIRLNKPGAKVNTKAQAKGYERNLKTEVSQKITDSNISSADFSGKSSDVTAKKVLGLFDQYNKTADKNEKIKVMYDTGPTNKISIYKGGKLIKTLNSNEKGETADAQYKELIKFVNTLDANKFLGGEKPKSGSGSGVNLNASQRRGK